MNILLVQRYNACLISKVLPYNPIGSVPINVTPPKKTELDDIDDDIDDDLPFLKTSVGGLSHDRDYKKYSYINVPTTVCKRKRNHMYFCSNRKEYQDDYCNLKFLRPLIQSKIQSFSLFTSNFGIKNAIKT